MTRKDYVKLASAVHQAHRDTDSDGSTVTPAAIASVAYKLAAILATDNPRFDRDRFLRACGVA